MFKGLTPPYDAIIADPPWRFSSNSNTKPGRNPRRHYQTLSPAEIAAFPVGDLAAPDCALFLWITSPLFTIGAHLPVLKAWGFKPSAVAFTWIKLTRNAASLFFLESDLHTGNGFTTRKNAEFCLLASRGRSLRQDRAVHEVILAPRREHSRKPDEFYPRVRRYVGPEARVAELFARERREGFDAWGNEVDKFKR